MNGEDLKRHIIDMINSIDDLWILVRLESIVRMALPNEEGAD